LEVRYDDKKLAKLCTDEREMRKKRADIADRLRLRVKALETAETVGELSTLDPLGNWHQLGANLDGLWSGKLSPNYRLLIRPEDSTEPWDAVTVTVIEIFDYHNR
jgi:proteic killer suppression protein